MFIDLVQIRVSAGRGGSGCMSFHREKFVDKGGPDGGDGGNGGSVILRANKQLHTLRDYNYRREYRAKRGQHGMGSNKHGKSAENIFLEVPVGTVAKDRKSGEVIADLVNHKQEFVIARGGEGGRGNARFATSVHRSPREWEVGELGEEREIELELKSIADVGLVGFPNAGKSTLLSRLSKARPKIADYPFTTLEPNLGIVTYLDYKSFIVADIPGLIEGAHQGKGLGHQFLRHIERTRVIAYMLDITDENPREKLAILQKELQLHSSRLAEKNAIIILNKIDMVNKIPQFKNTTFKIIAISAINGENIDKLKAALVELIDSVREAEDE